MLAVRVSDKCIKLWSTVICEGSRVRVRARMLASSEYIDGVVRELGYRYMVVETSDGLKYIRYPMVELIKVVLYER